MHWGHHAKQSNAQPENILLHREGTHDLVKLFYI